MELLRTSDLEANTIMESLNDSPILHLSVELQINCFSALGEVDGSLLDAFNVALTNKKLYAIYKEHQLEIDRHIVVRSSVHAYDMLLNRLDVAGRTMIPEVLQNPSTKFSHNVQGFNESMLPKSITSDDIAEAQARWKWSGKRARNFLCWQKIYESSPFPYRWDLSTRSSPFSTSLPSVRMAVRERSRRILLLPWYFKSRFHKVMVRWLLSRRLRLVETRVGSNLSEIYREWFDRISNRDKRWSFLEHLEGLEMNDFWFGFQGWAFEDPNDAEEECTKWESSCWYDEFCMMSVGEAGTIEYPDLADRALGPPDSLKRLISSESLPKNLEIALIQAWPSFRKNWPQTARSKLIGLRDSGEALAMIKRWLETGSSTERLLLEDSGRSSLQEWPVGFGNL